MPGFANGRFGRAGTVAILLVIAAAAITSTVGFHAHGTAFAAGDHASRPGSCHVCVSTDAPALPPPVCDALACVTVDHEPVTDAANSIRTIVIARPQLGRAPPAC